jgi:PPOX class probable FMN-dependent enzyme
MMSDTIADLSTLEQHFDEPMDIALACMFDSLDKYHQQFIEHSPFVCLATSDKDGQPTISPKGDAPGFVRVVDENTLVMPDRIGNNKVESFHNLVENPKMGLIFMVPGMRETLRISAEASITSDHEVLRFAQVGKNPVKTGLLIKISKVYFHCGKAMIRSKLWDENSKITPGTLPSFGQILKAQTKLDATDEEAEGLLENAYTNELY